MKTEPDEAPLQAFDGAASQGFDGAASQGFDGSASQGFDGVASQGFLGSLLRNNESTGPSSMVTSQSAGRPKRMTKKSRKQRPRVRLFKKYFK